MIACVGGGSNSIGIFTPFVEDAEVALIGVEAAGEGLDSGRHGASLGAGVTGVLHGSLSSVIADEEGQILEAHSVSAGLDYPGVGPEHAHLRDTRPRQLRRGHRRGRRWPPSASSARLEGIIPALESSHAIAWLLENPGGGGFDVLCLSGRGDKDLAEVIAHRRWERGVTRRATAGRLRRVIPQPLARRGRHWRGAIAPARSGSRPPFEAREGRRPGGVDALHDGRVS